MKKLIFSVFLFFCCMIVVSAEDLAPNSQSSILMNYETGKIVYEKNSNEKLAPASMTKMMTLLLIMEKIEDGTIKYTDPVVISENAANMGGSQIFIEANTQMKVEELIKGIAIASGNDAAVAMAEKVGGSVDSFVKMMNDKCKEIGCTNSNFVNVHGLDEENHYSSAHDMALIARELLHYQDILRFTSTYEEYLTKPDGTKIWLVNTNKLVRFMQGVDGLKTGFTTNAGYCLTATGLRNDIRFISVVMGVETSQKRSEDTSNLLTYGFNNYKINKVINEDVELGKVKIEKGKQKEGTLTIKENINELISIKDPLKEYQYNVTLNKNVKAPIKKGDKVGTLEILDNGNVAYTVDLTIKEDVEKSSLFDIFQDNMKLILCGKS